MIKKKSFDERRLALPYFSEPQGLLGAGEGRYHGEGVQELSIADEKGEIPKEVPIFPHDSEIAKARFGSFVLVVVLKLLIIEALV